MIGRRGVSGVAAITILILGLAGYVALSKAQDQPKDTPAVQQSSATAYQVLASQKNQLIARETHEVGTLTWEKGANELSIAVEAVVLYPFDNKSMKAGVLQVKGSHIDDAQIYTDEIEQTVQALHDMMGLLREWEAQSSNPHYRMRVGFSNQDFSFSLHRLSEADVKRYQARDQEYTEQRRDSLQKRIEAGDASAKDMLKKLEEESPNRRRPHVGGTLSVMPVEKLPAFVELLEQGYEILKSNAD